MEGDAPAATSAKGPFAGRQQQPSLSGATSHGPGVTSDLAGLSGCNTGDVGFRLPTTTRSSDFGPNKQNKHRAAEQRRRERINEKLAQLRELVPHDQRSNTATFLEGVIGYIQSLQQNNVVLESQLSALRCSKQQQHQLANTSTAAVAALAAMSRQQQQQQQAAEYAAGLAAVAAAAQAAQPCASGVGAGAAAAAAAGIVGGTNTPLSASPRAAGSEASQPLASAAAAAAAASSLSTGARMHAGPTGSSQHSPTLEQQPHPAFSGPAAYANGQLFGTSPPPAAAAAASAAVGLGAAAAAAESAAVPVHAAALLRPASAPPTATAAAAAAAGAGGVQVQLQPAELQSVLEKALLNALQQQAQQLAAQLSQSGH
uniref:BHLH domain-containing protein n=1 Tax=Tetradesmus obliquus TaxID=3088 RepID=A0A383W8Z7_TETOB|eukprot:jgi/Sobl393_1/4358/SZX74117.1